MSRPRTRRIAVLAFALIACAAPAAQATYTTAPEYAVSDFALGFTRGGCCNLGPFGIAFDSANNVYVSGDGFQGSLYRFPATGTPPFNAETFNLTPSGATWKDNCTRALAFSKTGRLYLAQCSANKVIELDPATGAAIRDVAPVVSAHGLGTDPLTGDLFVASYSGDAVYRIADPEGTPVVSTYLPSAGGHLDGLTIGPDGTIYVARASGATSSVLAITGTDKPQPATVTNLATVPDGDGVAVSAAPGNPQIFVNDNFGHITRLDIGTTVTSTVVFTNDDTNSYRGDFVGVGNDGCLYATQSERVVKLTNADGTCSLAPTSPTLPLDVTKSGNGSGGVTSAPAGIDCGATCSGIFTTGSTVTLTATPAPGSHFTGWSGTCSGTVMTCVVTMDQARTATATFVLNQPPVAEFTFAPAGPKTATTVEFDGSSSSDPDGTISSYAWTFGDGTTATGAKPSHAFATAGTFTVTLTVTDNDGATDSVTHAVPVTAPVIAPVPPPVVAVKPLVLQCTTKKLVLVDVVQSGGRVRLFGTADPSLAGQRVDLVFYATRKVVATATIAADGSYEATAPLPPRSIRNTNRARYQAVTGTHRSDQLKLTRRVAVDSLSAGGGLVTIRGRIIPPLGRPVQPVAIRQRISCKQMTVVKTFTPPPSGRFSVTLPAPTGQAEAIYVLVTRVRKGSKPRLYPTASLPRPVTLRP